MDYIDSYAGYILDLEELLTCSSGGIATALSKYVINSGGYVAGVTYSDDFYDINYKVTNELKVIDRFKGSKYAEAHVGTVFKEVKCLLDEGKQVLFFGLPCTLYALNHFLGGEYENLITCELVCHGPTSIRVHEQFIDYLENRFSSKIIDFSVRHKLNNWMPNYLYAKFENGKIYERAFNSTAYGYAFANMSRPSCYKCNFKENSPSDIVLGDFWGAKPSDTFWNDKGVSCIIVKSTKGKNILCETKGIKIIPVSFDRIIEQNRHILYPRVYNQNYDKFVKSFKKRGLFYAVFSCKNLKGKIKMILERFIPNTIISTIRCKYKH